MTKNNWRDDVERLMEESLERSLNNYEMEFISPEAFQAHKSFVKRYVTQAKQSERELIIEIIEKMKMDTGHSVLQPDYKDRKLYNFVIDKVINKIQNN